MVQRGGDWAGLLAVPNVTLHPSTASLTITVLLYDGPLLCGFNVAIKGLIVTTRCAISYCCIAYMPGNHQSSANTDTSGRSKN